MPHKVIISQHAKTDIRNLIAYIEEHDSRDRAEYVFNKINEALSSLSEFPDRGPHPPELLEAGNQKYREVFFKPYRIIYRVLKDEVRVLLISDGRRDMRKLLSRRLLSF